MKNNQQIINHRIHLIDTGGDSAGLLFSEMSIPHELAQFMYEYYTSIYDRIHDEFNNPYKKIPDNGLYIYFSEFILTMLLRERGEMVNDSFIEEQKLLRKKYFG
ncbi:MAG: hypothetical protein HeimC3_35620 [Candidatus Heimdallarchaeota archaeon LC_3]|nr:MAG: hypothetical protein HeimC3_35620 [Candidatus Heimdallarchaeota archaeon LC_3]